MLRLTPHHPTPSYSIIRFSRHPLTLRIMYRYVLAICILHCAPYLRLDPGIDHLAHFLHILRHPFTLTTSSSDSGLLCRP